MKINNNIIIYTDSTDSKDLFEANLNKEEFSLQFFDNAKEINEHLKSKNNQPALCFIDIYNLSDSKIAEDIKTFFEIQKNLEIVIHSSFKDGFWQNTQDMFGINDKIVFLQRPANPIMIKQFSNSKCYKWSLKRETEKLLTKLNDRINNQKEQIEKTEHTMYESARLRSIGEMASSVAHEINNPLTVIMTSAELTKSMVKKIENSELAQKLQKYNEKSEKMAKRISEIIKSMRNMAGRNDAEDYEDEILLNIVSDFKNLCEKKLLHRNIDLKISNISNDTLITCRKSHFTQILYNLVMNSLEALEHHDVQEKFIDLNFDIQEDNLHIIISDNGPGFTEEAFQKIFTPFFSTKAERSAPGLGLSVVKGLVESHKGTIHIETSDQGAIVKIVLPLGSQEPITFAA